MEIMNNLNLVPVVPSGLIDTDQKPPTAYGMLTFYYSETRQIEVYWIVKTVIMDRWTTAAPRSEQQLPLPESTP